MVFEGRNYGLQDDGCIRCYEEMHNAYVSGELSHDEASIIERYLMDCTKCEDIWDILTDKLLVNLPIRQREIDEDD